ncbi:MAG: hypothetical protein K0S34_1028 [Bacillales bacterium]|jgi:hypothetical protein|nr:hypothetical protein [Bacillales bacterium]
MFIKTKFVLISLLGLIMLSGCSRNDETNGINKCGEDKEKFRTKCVESVNSTENEVRLEIDDTLIDMNEIIIAHTLIKSKDAVNEHRLLAKPVVNGLSNIEIIINSNKGEIFEFRTKTGKGLSDLEKSMHKGVFVYKSDKATLSVSYKYKGKTINHKNVVIQFAGTTTK